MPDDKLSELLQIPISKIKDRRNSKHIPVHGGATRRAWTKAEDAMVGKVPDEVLAKRLGRTELGVATRRRQLGILWR